MITEIGIKVKALTAGAKAEIANLSAYITKSIGKETEINIDTGKSESKLDKLISDIEKLNTVISKDKRLVKELEAEYRKLIKTGGNTSEITAKIDRLNGGISNYKVQLAKARIESNKLKETGLDKYFSKIGNNLKSTITRIGAFTAAFAVIRGTKALFSNSLESSIEFESALAGVNKTMDLTSDEIAIFDRNLKKMSIQTGITYVELAKIAELGGQLGLPKDEVTDFTLVMAKLRKTTNLTSDDAILNFAKFRNATGDTNVSFEELGNTIVDLGNNTATTESQILTFGNRIAASGSLAGISANELLAFGAAFSSAGIEAEAGGTAINKSFAIIDKSVYKSGKNLEVFATVSGKTSDEFVEEWKTTPARAFADFLEGLQDSGKGAGDVLEELGLDSIRTTRTLLTGANATLKLSDALDILDESLIEQNALQEEWSKRADTTQVKLEQQTAQWKILGDYLGDEFKGIWVDLGDTVLDITAKLVASFISVKNTLLNGAITIGQGLLLAILNPIKELSLTASLMFDAMGLESWAKKTGDIYEATSKKITNSNNRYLDEINKNGKEAEKVYNSITDKDAALEKVNKKHRDAELKASEEQTKKLKDEINKLLDANTKASKKKADELKKELEKEEALIKKDAEKRLSILDRYNKKSYLDATNTSIKTSKRIVELNEDALNENLRNLDKYSGEELDIKEKEIKALNDVINVHTKNVEKQEKAQKKAVEKGLIDGIKEAQDEIDDLQDKIDKLNGIEDDKDIAIAERKVDILKEQAELEDRIAGYNSEQLRMAKSMSEESLKGVGESEFTIGGEQVSGNDLLDIKKDLQTQIDLTNELTENNKELNEETYNQIDNYDKSSETAKIMLDYKKELSDEELDLNGETIDTKIEQLEKEKDKSINIHEALVEGKQLWDTLYGESVKVNTDYVNSLRDLENAKLEETIALLKERNALLGITTEDTTDTTDTAASSNTINYNTDNSVININEASNVKTTAKNISKSDILSSRGATPSNNS